MIKVKISSDELERAKEYIIDKDEAILGRKSTCDICISSDHISREHLEISVQDDVIFIKDITKNNWVSYNDEPLPKNQSVEYFEFSPLALPGGFKINIEAGRSFEPDLDEITSGVATQTITRTKSGVSRFGTQKKTKIKKMNLKLEKTSGEIKSGRRPNKNIEKKIDDDKKKKVVFFVIFLIIIGVVYYYLDQNQ